MTFFSISYVEAIATRGRSVCVFFLCLPPVLGERRCGTYDYRGRGLSKVSKVYETLA